MFSAFQCSDLTKKAAAHRDQGLIAVRLRPDRPMTKAQSPCDEGLIAAPISLNRKPSGSPCFDDFAQKLV
jgi:hypothetical protein